MDTETVLSGTPPRPPWIVWAGLAVVLAAAAVLSFDELRQLALSVSITDKLAWLLPIVVDAGAAVSCATWLGNHTEERAARFAGRMTWALLAVTVAGNAGQLGMHANRIDPPWWVAVLVGMIPPAVVGSVVHLVVLLVRTAGPKIQTALIANVAQEVAVDDIEPSAVTPEDELVPAVRAWIAKQTGPVSQRQLRSEFGIGAERARKLMETA